MTQGQKNIGQFFLVDLPSDMGIKRSVIKNVTNWNKKLFILSPLARLRGKKLKFWPKKGYFSQNRHHLTPHISQTKQ